MQKPRLIATDVDGTLLAPLEVLTERTAAVIGRVRAAGVPVVLASGRPPRWIPRVAEPLGLTGYAVCANGAVLYDIGADEVLAVHGRLDPVQLHDIAEAVRSVLPGIGLAAERVGDRAEDADVRPFLTETGYYNPWGDGEECTATRAEVLGHPAIKLLISHRDYTADEMAVAARAVLDDSVDVTFSGGGGLIEVGVRGVSKATGLADVAARLDVPASAVLAFGDMPNDVEMLGWAGHGVAMANAHPEARAAADEITGPNSEDGVAQVLERWF